MLYRDTHFVAMVSNLRGLPTNESKQHQEGSFLSLLKLLVNSKLIGLECARKPSQTKTHQTCEGKDGIFSFASEVSKCLLPAEHLLGIAMRQKDLGFWFVKCRAFKSGKL